MKTASMRSIDGVKRMKNAFRIPRRLLGLSIIAGLLFATAVASVNRHGLSQPPSSLDPRVLGERSTHGVVYSMDASWAATYRTVPTLRAASDLVVAATIGRIVNVTPSSLRNPPFTDYAVMISTVVWDPKHLLTGQTIMLHQTGAIVGNARYEMGDDPLFNPGEQVVLFLHQFAPGQYFVVGGPTGRFRVQAGLVYPTGDEGVRLPAGTTESEFITTIRR